MEEKENTNETEKVQDSLVWKRRGVPTKQKKCKIRWYGRGEEYQRNRKSARFVGMEEERNTNEKDKVYHSLVKGKKLATI